MQHYVNDCLIIFIKNCYLASLKLFIRLLFVPGVEVHQTAVDPDDSEGGWAELAAAVLGRSTSTFGGSLLDDDPCFLSLVVFFFPSLDVSGRVGIFIHGWVWISATVILS